MNVYDFINSRDIAKYLKEINYQFSTLECAWLVWQSRKHTLAQKHAAWQEIIVTMPDCSVEARPNHAEVHSLHEYLKTHIDFERQLAKDFLNIEPQTFYNAYAYTNRGDAWDPSTHLSPEAAINHYITDYADAFSYHNEQIIGFNIDKIRLGEPQAYMTLSIDEQNQALDIKVKEKGDLFENLWFDFPTPFEKGDILVEATHGYNWLYPGGCCSQFVMESICTENDCTETLKKNGTFEDMLAYGYRVWGGYDKMYSYMDLEYADPSSPEFDKELLPISLFLKGEINVLEMAEGYRLLANERAFKNANLSGVLSDELQRVMKIGR